MDRTLTRAMRTGNAAGTQASGLHAIMTMTIIIIGMNLIHMILMIKSLLVKRNHEYNVRVQLEYIKRYLRNNVSL